ncbi:5'-3' exonuclease [endosymbiont GvMRE of Glomus versiforme]|uniref:5'-3' exonuclease n=1 Tax=endosymbiont GvMRE of Glomus versiforme TaxID=2039283 RepID=UPI000EE928FA|nr:5'-3' exonuclease [endosymbiont GvMRE of Glomus versiforme]RHZ35302.1 DNA polymerase I [endosymbiont GvMRE of Glomus versiforme]
MKQLKKRCLIIDGNNLLYSSYHISQKMSWKITNGTIFFSLRVLISVLKKNDYRRLIVFFDGGGTNFRKKIFPQYKAQRVEMPNELWEQMKMFKLLLKKTNISYIQLTNFEADDLIASFINQITKIDPNLIFDIFTRDKDLMQLINENTSILKYINKKLTFYTHEHFFKEYNFLPKNYIDYLSLLGDDVDNIKGIKGIGPVSAKSLIQCFSTIENIYQKLDTLPESIKNLLMNKQEVVFLNKRIISLEENIPLSIKKNEIREFYWKKWKNNEELQRFCTDNNFLSILKLLN